VAVTVTTCVAWTVVEVVWMEPAGAPGATGLEGTMAAGGLDSSGMTGMTLVTISAAAGGVVVMTAGHATQVCVKVCVVM
jgi:hypothetical protein